MASVTSRFRPLTCSFTIQNLTNRARKGDHVDVPSARLAQRRGGRGRGGTARVDVVDERDPRRHPAVRAEGTAHVAAPLGEMDGAAAAGLVAVVWFGTEAALAKAAGWHVSFVSPVAWFVRDLMLPVVWLKGWIGDGFTWRGNDMTVAEPDVASPQGRA